MRPADTPVIVSDCTRAHELLGWRARRLEAGLAVTHLPAPREQYCMNPRGRREPAGQR